MQEYLIVGEVLKPQGVRGEIKVQPHTDDPERFKALRCVYGSRKEGMERLGVVSTRVREGYVYMTLEGVDSRDAAEEMRGMMLYVHRDNAVPLGRDRWFIADLIGISVVTEGGETLGILSNVLQPGATDVYEVKGKKDFLFPALKRVVKKVDIQKGVMVVDEEALSEVAVFED